MGTDNDKVRPDFWWQVGRDTDYIDLFPDKEYIERRHFEHPERSGYTWGDFRGEWPELYAATFGREPWSWYSLKGPAVPEKAAEDPEDSMDEPDPDSLFDITMVAGYMDGDWPPLESWSLSSELPEEFLEEFGVMYDTVLNGSHRRFRFDTKDTILARLRSLGYSVREAGDDDLD